ncbi:MAG: alpha-glucosidase/alpha-galactosidase [Chloroflexota bacterium]
MPKIAFIGAGSTIFAKNLIGDMLLRPGIDPVTIALHDIDQERLGTSEIVARRVADSVDCQAEIIATTDRRQALEQADYVIAMFQVAGYEPGTVIDFEVPKRYGLRQTIGDTIGIGGIMRGLRTIPVMLDIARDMEELCPDALLLNYVNPMSILCLALNRATSICSIGLCHSVQDTVRSLAYDLKTPQEEIQYLCAGINHMAFYLSLEHKGESLYPALHKIVTDGRVPAGNRVRYEMLERLGYFVTESSVHLSEYVPWFIKRDRPDLISKFNIPLDEYPRRCREQIKGGDALRADLEDPSMPLPVELSSEYASRIIASIESGTEDCINGNVMNDGLIDNLPANCVVEVPIKLGTPGTGYEPQPVGALPPHLAALIQTNVNVHLLTVEAALTGKREHIYHAAMMDPHTAAELDLDQIWSLVDDLIEAHGDWLPAYH